MSTSRCGGTTKAGEPCQSFVYRDGLCRMHAIAARGDDAELKALRRQQSQGGRSKANVERAKRELRAIGKMDVTDALEVLSVATYKVYAGEMEPGVGTALASMVGAIARVKHTEELEARLCELEEYARLR